MDPFTTLEAVQARLDWDLDEAEERIATAAIEDASDLAREYGREWAGPSTAPRIVIKLTLRAVTRYMKNPNGYTTSRAGDETLQWADDAGRNMGDVYFTDEEQEMISRAAGRSSSGFASVGSYAWNSNGTTPKSPLALEVPTSPGGDGFTYFASEDEPW